jgi:C4-dicarboxylate-specific signal transduction histidine kinase
MKANGRPSRKEVHIMIADNGCGIPEAFRGNLFCLFTPAKATLERTSVSGFPSP